jgi:hypothetical protein
MYFSIDPIGSPTGVKLCHASPSLSYYSKPNKLVKKMELIKMTLSPHRVSRFMIQRFVECLSKCFILITFLN